MWYKSISKIITTNFQDHGFTSISINLDTQHLLDNTILNSISELKEFPICIEWTERKLAFESENCLNAAVENLESICQKNNFFLCLDDMGRGESCIRRLFLTRPCAVKIDGKIYQQSKCNEYHANLFKNYVNYLKSANIPIVIEWIEDLYDLGVANSLNMDFAQGFYWHYKDIEKIKHFNFEEDLCYST